jgi:hypothetical protein
MKDDFVSRLADMMRKRDSERLDAFVDAVGKRVAAKSGDASRDQQMQDAMTELARLTTDDGITAAVRGAKVYLAIVRHVAAGGRVVFVGADGSERVLSVRLR